MPVFHEQWREPADVDEAIDDWISLRTSGLGNHGYVATVHGQTITYRRRRTPVIAIVLGVLTFPFGILLWVLWKRDEVFTIHFEATPDGGAAVTAKGEAKDAVRWQVIHEAAEEAEWSAVP